MVSNRIYDSVTESNDSSIADNIEDLGHVTVMDKKAIITIALLVKDKGSDYNIEIPMHLWFFIP